MKNNKFYDSWKWLDHHIYFSAWTDYFNTSYFEVSLNIDVVKVNPETNEIDDDSKKNTKVQVWLECGDPILDENNRWQGDCSHDPKLDVGGDTFEEAIIKLSELVKKEYGDYK